jgi:hypothetical protein
VGGKLEKNGHSFEQAEPQALLMVARLLQQCGRAKCSLSRHDRFTLRIPDSNGEYDESSPEATVTCGLLECLHEAARYEHMQLRCADVFDRLEYLDRLADGWHFLIEKGNVPADSAVFRAPLAVERESRGSYHPGRARRSLAGIHPPPFLARRRILSRLISRTLDHAKSKGTKCQAKDDVRSGLAGMVRRISQVAIANQEMTWREAIAMLRAPRPIQSDS